MAVDKATGDIIGYLDREGSKPHWYIVTGLDDSTPEFASFDDAVKYWNDNYKDKERVYPEGTPAGEYDATEQGKTPEEILEEEEKEDAGVPPTVPPAEEKPTDEEPPKRVITYKRSGKRTLLRAGKGGAFKDKEIADFLAENGFSWSDTVERDGKTLNVKAQTALQEDEEFKAFARELRDRFNIDLQPRPATAISPAQEPIDIDAPATEKPVEETPTSAPSVKSQVDDNNKNIDVLNEELEMLERLIKKEDLKPEVRDLMAKRIEKTKEELKSLKQEKPEESPLRQQAIREVTELLTELYQRRMDIGLAMDKTTKAKDPDGFDALWALLEENTAEIEEARSIKKDLLEDTSKTENVEPVSTTKAVSDMSPEEKEARIKELLTERKEIGEALAIIQKELPGAEPQDLLDALAENDRLLEELGMTDDGVPEVTVLDEATKSRVSEINDEISKIIKNDPEGLLDIDALDELLRRKNSLVENFEDSDKDFENRVTAVLDQLEKQRTNIELARNNAGLEEEIAELQKRLEKADELISDLSKYYRDFKFIKRYF
jgi:hypothetical protein